MRERPAAATAADAAAVAATVHWTHTYALQPARNSCERMRAHTLGWSQTVPKMEKRRLNNINKHSTHDTQLHTRARHPTIHWALASVCVCVSAHHLSGPRSLAVAGHWPSRV